MAEDLGEPSGDRGLLLAEGLCAGRADMVVQDFVHPQYKFQSPLKDALGPA